MISIAQFLAYSIFIFWTVFADSSCPPRWKHDPKGKMCYYVSRLKMTHNDAHLYCQKLSNSSHLLRVQCESENNFVSNLMKPNTAAWIDARARFDIIDGAAGLFSPGFVLRWPNGKIVRFTNWAHGNGVELIDRSSKCVHIQSTTGEWQNAACDEPATVICEKRLHRPVIRYCPKHWMYMDATQSCYRAITRTNMTILDADNRCFQLGSESNHDAMLASIGDELENQFIKDLARETNPNFDFVMLGAFGRSNNGHKWKWMDGTPFTYQNWDRGMPFGRRALAVLVMNRRGKWINHYADRILSQYNAVAVCKLKP
ncbi:lectin C-type domain protein [Cooperia oncophora]